MTKQMDDKQMDAALQVFKPERTFQIIDPTSSFYRRENWSPQRSSDFLRMTQQVDGLVLPRSLIS